MKVLLDTHAFAWALADSRRLSEWVRDLLFDRKNEVLVSVAAAYEITYKRERDADLDRLPRDLIAAAETFDFGWVPLHARQAILAASFPKSHKDPWDRLVAAQGLDLTVPIISVDKALAELGATLIW